eukprot:9562051-Alexandrium_andersonii.AAC.1
MPADSIACTKAHSQQRAPSGDHYMRRRRPDHSRALPARASQRTPTRCPEPRVHLIMPSHAFRTSSEMQHGR